MPPTLLKALNRVIKPINLRLADTREQTPTLTLPDTHAYHDNPIGHIAFVGSREGGLSASGKGRPSFLLGCQYGLIRRGVTCSLHQTPKAFIAQTNFKCDVPTAVIFIYNEEFQNQYPSQHIVASLSSNGFAIINDPHDGRILASKIQTHARLTSHSIPVPPVAPDMQGRYFSTADLGSGLPAHVVDTQDHRGHRRHNAELIDTRFVFQKRGYYTCIRAATFGTSLVDAWIRFRDAKDDNPSVHTRDTPLNPEAIEYFQTQLVANRLDDIKAISRRFGDAFGLGTFVLDILPCTTTGRLMVCEAGYKYDDYVVRDHLAPIAAYLPSLSIHFSNAMADKLAEAIVTECISRGIFKTRQSELLGD